VCIHLFISPPYGTVPFHNRHMNVPYITACQLVDFEFNLRKQWGKKIRALKLAHQFANEQYVQWRLWISWCATTNLNPHGRGVFRRRYTSRGQQELNRKGKEQAFVFSSSIPLVRTTTETNSRCRDCPSVAIFEDGERNLPNLSIFSL